MFGKSRNKPADPKPVAPVSQPAPMRLSGSEAEPAPSGSGKRVATFETLGQTLVVTVISEVLSGGDAREMITEIASRSAYAADRADARPSLDGEVGASAPRHFVLDLQNVEYMDSACLGSLVELLTSMQSRGGRIALVNAGRNVEYLFRLTQLDRVFPICREVITAIEAVERGLGGLPSQNGKNKGGKKRRA